MNAPTKADRQAAHSFYSKTTTGFEQDWIDDGAVITDIDADVIALAQLLADTRARERAKCADWIREMVRRTGGFSIVPDDEVTR